MSLAKIDENFADYFLTKKVKNKFFLVIKSTCLGLQKKYKRVYVVKINAKSL